MLPSSRQDENRKLGFNTILLSLNEGLFSVAERSISVAQNLFTHVGVGHMYQ